MDNNKPAKDRETIVEIGTSESECEEDRRLGNKRAKTVVRSVGGIFSFEGSEDGECSSNSYRTSVKSSDDDNEDIESLTHYKLGKNSEHKPLLEKIKLKEKRKIPNSKKAPKPPRPRKGPSLDTADWQLVKEIAEQTMKRRARVERMKSLKRKRAANSLPPPASSNISLFAMAITILFFIVIIFQGFSSGQSSNLSFDDSPKSSGAPSSSLISIQLGNNPLESNGAHQIANPPRRMLGDQSSMVQPEPNTSQQPILPPIAEKETCAKKDISHGFKFCGTKL